MGADYKPETADYRTYRPIFRQDVYVTFPDGQQTQINPRECLTDGSTAELVKILQTAGVPCKSVQGTTLAKFGETLGGGITATSEVNWIEFDGIEVEGKVYEKAGELANLWVINSDGAVALRSALQDMNNVARGN